MKISIILLIVGFLLILGCVSTPDTQSSSKISLGSGVQRWHDDELSVTCWITKHGYSGGISCILDSELKR